MGEPTIYKPSIYNGNGIYKNGAASGGGGDVSPDIPEDLKGDFTQIESLQTTGNNYIDALNLNTFKSTDVFLIDVYIARLIDTDRQVICGFETPNRSGNIGFQMRGDTQYYPSISSMWFKTSGSDNLTTYSDTYLGELFSFVVNNQMLYYNGELKKNNLSVGSLVNMQSLSFFMQSNNQTWALKKFEIVDNMSLQTKLKFIPCKNNQTEKFGLLETINKVFYGNSYGTDMFNEYKPPA